MAFSLLTTGTLRHRWRMNLGDHLIMGGNQERCSLSGLPKEGWKIATEFPYTDPAGHGVVIIHRSDTLICEHILCT
jgi:hypothetical protein